jgi:hypothetical protein
MMTRLSPVLFLLLVLPAMVSAQTQADERTRVAEIERLALDLKTLQRVVEVATDLRPNRQVMLAIVDEEIEMLREPRGDGSYRWASLQREEGGRVQEETRVQRVHTEESLDSVTLTATNPYRIEVSVPARRALMTANRQVYVRRVVAETTSLHGQVTRSEIPVGVWIMPRESHGIALPEIARSAKVTVELGVESGTERAVAEVAVLQARLTDDPRGPWYPALRRLGELRGIIAADSLRKGELASAIDEAIIALPRELEQRVALFEAAAADRRRLVDEETHRGGIRVGDATPDVIAELEKALSLLSGTIDEQARAREEMKALVHTLRKVPSPAP